MGRKWLALEVARVRAGLTQLDLALQAGLSESTVAKLESLRRRPTAAEVARLAEVLGVDAEELVRDLLEEEAASRASQQDSRP
jgi:transcriptional regulator with XRE-family HTH domain